MGGADVGLREDLAELRARVVSLEDERAVVATLHRFTHYIDYGRELEFVELFTVDGVFEVRHRQTSAIARRAGRAELSRYIAGHTRAPRRFHKHLLLQPVIALDGAIARVESYFAVLEEREGGPYVKTYGRYLDTLAKEGGTWRFRERIAEVEVRQPTYRFSGDDAGPQPTDRGDAGG
jgi:SnoaL-like domain